MIQLTARGRRLIERAIAAAFRITEETLAPLDARERAALLELLQKLT
jgi:DNA-binding MarR family transcriptional regulator